MDQTELKSKIKRALLEELDLRLAHGDEEDVVAVVVLLQSQDQG